MSARRAECVIPRFYVVKTVLTVCYSSLFCICKYISQLVQILLQPIIANIARIAIIAP